jgi:hypothetical protein
MFFYSTLALVKNHTHEWNTFTSWFTLKSYYLFFVIILFLFLLTHFFNISIYSEIEFIKPADDVKIQRKIITFSKCACFRTVFINKMINSGIMKMFIFFYIFYIYMFYFVSQVLCIFTYDDYYSFSMRNKHFLYCNDFIFPSFNNLMKY